MKSIALLLVLSGLAGAASDAPAQRPERNRGKWSQLKSGMELDPRQEEALEAARKIHMDLLRPLVEGRRELVKKLADQIAANQGDMEAAVAAIKSATQAINAENERFDEAMRPILTPRQRALYVLDSMKGLLPARTEGSGGDAAASKTP
ncbi:MAG: periplasmic heavy metal sensor [Elusimicrobiota bacterium]